MFLKFYSVVFCFNDYVFGNLGIAAIDVTIEKILANNSYEARF